MSNEIYNPKEAAELLNISVQTLMTMAHKGRIAYIKIGSRYRFDQTTIEGMLTPTHAKQTK